MRNAKDCASKMKELDAQIDAILKSAESAGGELTEEQERDIARLESEWTSEKAAYDKAIEQEDRARRAAVRKEFLSKPIAPGSTGTDDSNAAGSFVEAQTIEFPMVSWGSLRNLSILQGLDKGAQKRVAHRFGVWCMAAIGNRRAQRWCKDNGLPMISAIHEEGTNTTGGYLVPPEFDSMMIDLREQYGVFRQNARISPMSRETKSRPRRTGGLTAYFVAEQGVITESTKSWDRVNLTAKDLYVLSRYTGQLDDDAAIVVGDDLAGEIAYAFALKEDQCGFLGDGTSAYGGITGLQTKVTAATAGIVTAASGTSTNWGGVTLANFNSMVGLLPQYAETPRTAWFCSKAFHAGVMERVAYAAGGNTVDTVVNGVRQRTFLGYPVHVSQVLPAAASAVEVVCFFGDLSLAADFGDRRGTTLAFSTEATIGGESMFERNEVAIRGWERFDINVHDVGNTLVSGPIVGLKTAS